MDGCSSMSPWTNIYRSLETSRSISLLDIDPIQELEKDGQESSSQVLINTMVGIPWGDQGPMMSPLTGMLGNNVVRSQQFDTSKGGATSAGSMDQSLDCLLSGTNSNTDTSVEDDDGISMLFGSDCRNLWNFSSNYNPTNNNVVSPRESTKPQSHDHSNSRKRNNMQIVHEDQDSPQFNLVQETTNMRKGNKRQRCSDNMIKLEGRITSSSNISFQQGSSSTSSIDEPDAEAIQQMKEMIYRAAAFRPVNFGVEAMEKPRRKNVRISSDPQTVAARQRRERISERLRVLQKLVPGGSKMDTASMLDEAANYLKFLRNQVKSLEAVGNNKLDHYHFPSSNTSNHHFPPINLQFSSMPFPMQAPQFLLQSPNHVHVPKS